MNQVFRFLLLGALAAAINWVARFPLSLVMPFPGAVFSAYMVGMCAGFVLYRTYVFPGSDMPVRVQVALFAVVNAIGAVIVLGTATGLLHVVLPALGWAFHPEAVAHGLAIGIGAAGNFLGHKFLTFRIRPDARAPATPS